VIKGPIGPNFAFDIGDDGVLIWLKDNSGGNTAAAVKALNTYQQTVGDTGIVEWLSGPLLTLNYQDPAHDSRTPDIIGIARVGVIYTSGSKIAEHGGFNEDDTHVALVVSHPDVAEQTVNATVATTQIAPTILKVLGIDPDELDGVRIEGTPDELVTARIDVHDYVEDKRKAFGAHSSQNDPNSWFTTMASQIYELAFGTEYYQLVRGTAGSELPEADLFAGIK